MNLINLFDNTADKQKKRGWEGNDPRREKRKAASAKKFLAFHPVSRVNKTANSKSRKKGFFVWPVRLFYN